MQIGNCSGGNEKHGTTEGAITAAPNVDRERPGEVNVANLKSFQDEMVQVFYRMF